MIRTPHCQLVFILLCIVNHQAFANDEEKEKPPPDFGNFGGLGLDKPCPSFRCSGRMTPVQKSRSKYTSSGCSAMGGGSMMMMAGPPKKEAYSVCCDLWHACYQTCGASKKGCDKDFDACSKENCGADEECSKSANMNTMMLQFGGCQKFDAFQYQACDCVSKDKAPEKRATAIRTFYKKNAPENAAKADQLAKKADTTGKMAGLFKKLLAKYPGAIAQIEDPQQAMYQNIMNDANKAPPKKPEEKVEETEEIEDDADEIQEL